MKRLSINLLFLLSILTTNIFSLELEKVSMFKNSSLFLINDNNISSVGQNLAGALGDGTIVNKNSLVTVQDSNNSNLHGIKQVVSGGYHSLFLKHDGTVIATGQNNYGQCGFGNNIDTNKTIQIPGLANVVKIVAGEDYSAFLLSNGDVYAAGRNNFGQLGLGDNVDRNSTTKIPSLSNIVDIEGGYQSIYFLDNNGSVLATGANSNGQLALGNQANVNTPTLITDANITNIVQIASGGGTQVLFLRDDGKAFSVGGNQFGQLGLGNTNTPVLSSVEVTGYSGTIKKIISGGNSTGLIMDDGRLYVSGQNSSSQLGFISDTSDKTSPTLHPSLTNVNDVVFGNSSSIYLLNTGEIYVAGINSQGELGLGHNTTDQEIQQLSGVLIQNILPPKLILKTHGGALQLSADHNSTFVADINSSLSSASLEFWINTRHETNTSHSIGGLYGDSNQTIELSIKDDVIQYSASNGVDTRIIYGSNIVNDGSWHHVALVFDNNILSNVYLDGIDDLGDLTGIDPSAFILNNPQLKLQTNNLVDMSIDEVRIWNIARTQVDIKETINQQLDGNETELVAYYNFDERIGDTVKNIKGNGYDGIIDGNVTRLNFLGDGLSFDGAGDTVPVSTTLSTTSYTKALWFKAPSSPSGNFISTQGSGHYFWFSEANKIGVAHGGTTASGSTGLTSINDYNDNQWHYATVTYDSSTTNMKLYIDGVLEVENSGVTQEPTDSTIEIGSYGSGNGSFNGLISQVSIWDKELNQTEIQKNMYSLLKGDESELVGYWPLNDGNGSTTAKDYSSNSNDGTITGATWVDTAPTIYGNTIYTDYGINSWEKVVTQNVGTPAFTQLATNNNISNFNPATGVFLYSSISGDESLDIQETSESLNLTVNVQSTLPTFPITLNLSNLNLDEHNITNIFLVNSNNYAGYIDNNNSVSIADVATKLSDGETSFTETISFTNYFIVIETDMGTQQQMLWVYHKDNGKLYSSYDFSITNNSFFIMSDSSINIDASYTWVDTQSNNGDNQSGNNMNTGTDNNSNFLGYHIPEMNFKIDASEYNITALSLDNNNVNSFYFLNTYTDYDETQVLRLEKILLGDTKVFGVDIKIHKDNADLQELEYWRDNLDKTSNIITMTENNIDIAETKLKEIIDNNALTTLYEENTDLNFTINFPEDAKGYEFYEKQIKEECYIWSDSHIIDQNISNKNDLITNFQYDNVNYNVIEHNRYDTSKALVFGTDGNNTIYEADFQNQNYTIVGNYEELNSKKCIDESNNNSTFTSTSILKFNLTVNGYENIALIKNANGLYTKGEYREADYTSKTYGLNQVAKTYLAEAIGLNTTPLLTYKLEYDWNYLSLPTNTTLCIDAYKSELTDICYQDKSIENVFTDQNLTVFKYNGNSWSHFTTDSSKIYNMDKLSSISQKDGLLIYSPYITEIKIPFHIDSFKFSSFNIYEKGWHLVGNQFKRSGSKIADIVTNQDFSLKYILNQTKDTNETAPSWKVYAPLNDNDVNSSLKRIEYVQPMDAFWIYVDE